MSGPDTQLRGAPAEQSAGKRTGRRPSARRRAIGGERAGRRPSAHRPSNRTESGSVGLEAHLPSNRRESGRDTDLRAEPAERSGGEADETDGVARRTSRAIGRKADDTSAWRSAPTERSDGKRSARTPRSAVRPSDRSEERARRTSGDAERRAIGGRRHRTGE